MKCFLLFLQLKREKKPFSDFSLLSEQELHNFAVAELGSFCLIQC